MSNHADDGYVPIMEDKLGPSEDWKDERGIYSKVGELQAEDLPVPFQKYLNKRVKTRYAKRTWYNRVAAAKHWMAFCVFRSESQWEDEVDVCNPSVVDIEDFIDDQIGAGYNHSTVCCVE